MDETNSSSSTPESVWQGDDLFQITLTPGIIQTCFLVILGRPAGEGDIASHLSAKNVGDLRQILLLSDEFRLDKAPRVPAPPRPTLVDIEAVKTIFLHIPKTGGTSLSQHLDACFPAGQISPDRFDVLYQKSAGSLARLRLFYGHYCWQSCDLIPGPKRVVTMLRHPVSRLISLYHFLRSHSDAVIQLRDLFLHRLARRNSLVDFFSLDEVRQHPAFQNAMVSLLAGSVTYDHWEFEMRVEEDFDAFTLLDSAKAHLAGMTAFGLMEKFEESVTIIFQALELPRPTVVKAENVLEKIAGRAYGIERVTLEPVSEEAQAAMASLVKADLELYRFAEALFEERMEKMQSKKPS